ncbi:PREDICTED: adaptin ear-binding coat-associated protein 2-like, partial [Bison bison bison]|uniref:Adaptin ear-binding coat-associated protein 2-like n=1 Tax=Bison bison bison TaxID=43346 RepID=A0A6P3HG74_BISBB
EGVNTGQPAPSSPLPSSFLPRWVKQQCEFAKQAQNPDQGPKLDLSFKEGQTIKLNIAASLVVWWFRVCLQCSGYGFYHWSGKIPDSVEQLSLCTQLLSLCCRARAPQEETPLHCNQKGRSLTPLSLSLLFFPLDLGTSVGGATVSWPQPKPATTATADIWGDFTKSTGSTSSQTQPGAGWVQF